MRKKFLFLLSPILIAVWLLIGTKESYAAWQIDHSSFNSWLCNNVKGAQQACYAPPRGGNFRTFQECENARRSALPYDVR